MKSGRTSSNRVRWNLHTVSLLGIVLSMGYAGAVQNNGAAYLLCFVTAVLAAMTWLRARENLRGVQISMGRLAGGKAGEATKLPLELRAALDTLGRIVGTTDTAPLCSRCPLWLNCFRLSLPHPPRAAED